MEINILGALNPVGPNRSWAIVNSSFAHALSILGNNVHCKSTNGIHSIDPRITPLLTEKLNESLPLFRYGNPERIDYAGKQFLMTAYETSVLPEEWIKILKETEPELIVNSEYQQDIFNQNGFHSYLCHLGVNRDKFNPEIEPFQLNDNNFKFLSVGIPHYRKGFDILLKAFSQEFKTNEEVSLYIKTDKLTAPQTWEIDIDKMVNEVRHKSPKITIIHGDCDNIGALYAACDCLVSPSRGEGFGMTIAEATACGLHTIASDFIPFSTDPIITKTVEAPAACQYHAFSTAATMREPSLMELKRLMRLAYVRSYAARLEKITDTPRIRKISAFPWKNSALRLSSIMGAENMDYDFQQWRESNG